MTLSELALPVLGGTLVHLAGFGVGDALGERVAPDALRASSRAERLLYAVVLGIAVLGAVAFVLAAGGWLYRPALIAVLAAGAALGAARLRSLAREGAPPTAAWIPFAVAAAVVVVFLPSALYPVLVHDEAAHHMLLPRLHLAHHGFARLPWNLFANMPHMVDLFNVYPLAVGDYLAVRVMHLGYQALAVGCVAALVARKTGALGGLIGAVLLAGGNNFLWHVGIAHVEPVIGLLLLAAVVGLERDAWILAGIACGAALQSKYTAWFFVAAILAGEMTRRRFGRLAACGGIAALLVLPWLVKSAILTGNPIYPNLFGVLGGDGWSAIQATQLARSAAVPGGLPKTPGTYALIPLRLILDNGGVFFCPTFSAALMAAFLASFAIPRSWRGGGAALQLTGLLGLAGWAGSVEQGRFLVAWVPVMAYVGCRTLEPLGARRARLGAALAAVTVLTAAQIVLQPFERRPVLDVFRVPKAELLERNFAYADSAFLDRAMAGTGRFLGMWENRFAFADRPFESDSAFEAPWALARLRALGDPDAFARELASRGITFVVLNDKRFGAYSGIRLRPLIVDGVVYTEARFRRDLQILEEFRERWLEPLPWRGEWTIYRLRAAAGG